MEQKIFNSVESRIRCNLDSEFKFYSWWLRSTDIIVDDRDPHQYLGYVDFFNNLNSIYPGCYMGILPVCTI